MSPPVRRALLFVLICYSGAATAQLTDILREAREQSGRLAQECKQKAPSDPSYNSCAVTCDQVASFVTADTPPDASAAMLKMCTDSYEIAGNAAAAAPPRHAAPQLTAQVSAPIPAQPAVPSSTGASAAAGRPSGDLMAEVVGLNGECEPLSKTGPGRQGLLCVRACSRAAGYLKNEPQGTYVNDSVRRCRVSHTLAMRGKAAIESGNEAAEIDRLMAECRIVETSAEGQACLSQCNQGRALSLAAGLDACLTGYGAMLMSGEGMKLKPLPPR